MKEGTKWGSIGMRQTADAMRGVSVWEESDFLLVL